MKQRTFLDRDSLVLALCATLFSKAVGSGLVGHLWGPLRYTAFLANGLILVFCLLKIKFAEKPVTEKGYLWLRCDIYMVYVLAVLEAGVSLFSAFSVDRIPAIFVLTLMEVLQVTLFYGVSSRSKAAAWIRQKALQWGKSLIYAVALVQAVRYIIEVVPVILAFLPPEVYSAPARMLLLALFSFLPFAEIALFMITALLMVREAETQETAPQQKKKRPTKN